MTLSLTKETGNVGEFTYAGREGYAINNCQGLRKNVRENPET